MTNPLNTPHGVASASLAEESLRRHKVELAPCAPRSCWEVRAGLSDLKRGAADPARRGLQTTPESGERGQPPPPRAFPRGVLPSLGFTGGKAEKAAGEEGRPAHGYSAQDLRARGQRGWWRPFPALGARPALAPTRRNLLFCILGN